ncbi:aromatic ring-hydroxylating dioxygenase subunit alpha [Breoghania sp. L-A4]|uniref:aromatic ring-hydroxylating oxygenase subunit alpha n=1 Tax=Breoghania sp. L-A4 TaxID=2304600 RepID=UPI000E35B685|nr:aromatic ring-hydroxylating dioxygenase subunit alpha [Breoghania sp. L-A4]AXS42194.1 aromatic ring-hydroxylating dioxygenase subunit alpha [Breoghania sp. L-A4]
MTLSIPVEDLVRRRLAGASLEAPFYISRAIYDLDVDLIFHRHWIFVATGPDVPEPGDCMTVEVGKASVLLLRGEDMQVRAFHNVCRHRGARLIQDHKSTVGNVVCRYHQWTYGETGDLLFAEHMGADFDKSCHGLKPVHLRSVGGLLFICLADEPPADIDRMEAQLTPYLAPHDLDNCKIAYSYDLIEPGNWKLTMENNRECYHCVGNHPELTIPLQEYGFGFAPDELDDFRKADVETYREVLADSYARWAGMGLPSEELDELTTAVTGFRTQRLALMGAGESHTMDTRVASQKLLGNLTDARLGGLSVWTHPNSWHHFMSDHVVTFSVLPIGPDRTLLRTNWLVHKDAVAGRDYDLENLTKVWLMTNQQDNDLVAMAHAGVEQPGYEPGPYSRFTEGFVEKFCEWYIDRLSAHLLATPSQVAAE